MATGSLSPWSCSFPKPASRPFPTEGPSCCSPLVPSVTWPPSSFWTDASFQVPHFLQVGGGADQLLVGPPTLCPRKPFLPLGVWELTLHGSFFSITRDAD